MLYGRKSLMIKRAIMSVVFLAPLVLQPHFLPKRDIKVPSNFLTSMFLLLFRHQIEFNLATGDDRDARDL